MRIPKSAFLFLVGAGVVVYLTYIRDHYNDKKQAPLKHTSHTPVLDSHSRPTSAEVVGEDFQYGIMFDAGSTGTRIHVFKFLHQPDVSPKLAHETFKAIKPGLSAYADDPERCGEGIHQLLEVAKESVPESQWDSTPLVLKATAGLRLLPGEKAKQLLDKVREIFKASPFLYHDDSVSIMDGTDEGVSAWITINFLIGGLHVADTPTVGMLDLGGGSTQITFSPLDEKTIQTSPDDITSLRMFNLTYTLFSHSYLGLGLMSARLAILGGTEGQPLPEGQELISPCLAPDYTGQWEHAEITYALRGQKEGEPMYESCLKKVEKMLYKKVKKAENLKDMEFFAFSYYYDRAVDLGIIDEKTGGSITVHDYIEGAKKVCNNMAASGVKNPFVCLDLTYISMLLQELGFPLDKVFKLARTINGVETSWALGATFHFMEALRAL